MTTVNTSQTRIGSDIGGTFTDVAAIAADGRLKIGKRLTTHGAEADGVLEAISDTGVGIGGPDTIVAHGSTLVINALLERRGVETALVTTRGFGDVLELARSSRPEIFNPFYHRDPVLIPAERRFEISERMAGDGTVEVEPSESEIKELIGELSESGVSSVAISLLNSYINPVNEVRIRDAIQAALPDVRTTISSDLSRKWREWERTATAAANAYVVPVAHAYIDRLLTGLHEDGFEGELIVLDSSGGAMDVDTARALPIQMVESGPLGGIIGSRDLAVRLGIDKAVTFDMGGTTAKSCLIENGEFDATEQYWIGGYDRGFPLQIRCVDVTEVGAAGGSIAWRDEADGLHVGPRSAGSVPGPACYGLGGTQPTVTDANVFTGRLPTANFSASIALDADAAGTAVRGLAAEVGMDERRLALGILKLANLSMARVVRRQTLERGRDPREFTLIASGGAGPMHACEVAAEVGIRQVLIPNYPGHYSAIGMLSANLRRGRRELLVSPLTAELGPRLRENLERLRAELQTELLQGVSVDPGELTVRYTLFIRQREQDHVLAITSSSPGTTVPEGFADEYADAFLAEYETRYGHALSDRDLELAEFEVVVERQLPQPEISAAGFDEAQGDKISSWFAGIEGAVSSSVINRRSLQPGDTVPGPAIIVEEGSTTVVPPRAIATCLPDTSILIDISDVTV